MSQLNLYLPESLAAQVRSSAKKQKMSISKYVAKILERDGAPTASGWDKDFFTKVAGKWNGELVREPTLPMEERDQL